MGPVKSDTRANKRRGAELEEAEAESTREKILVAALETFSDRGFDGAKTREIAERADANLGLIKYYFGTKEELWKAAVDRAFEELRQETDPGAVEDLDDRGAVAELLRRFILFAGHHPQFMRLMNDEGKREGPRMRWLVDRHVKPIYTQVERVVKRGQKAGAMPRFHPLHFHYLAVGAGILFSQAPECERLTGIDPLDPKRVEDHVQAVTTLLLGPE